MWKDIKGYEGFYQVSTNGEVKSIRRFRKNGTNGYFQKEIILKKTIRTRKGYLCVNLSKNGETSIKSIHRLVAETFIPNTYNKEQVNHKDGNKFNNNVENLEWCTCKENIIHCDKILGRKRNKEGLKLGSIACTKKNLNVTNGEKIFQSYKEIKEYLEKLNKKEYFLKTIQNGIRKCCTGVQKTFCGFKWKYVK